jgi:ADP-ribose pyrophosphatase YjhB (NUDIX family)
VRRHLAREVSQSTFESWNNKKRLGEVVLFIRRPNGKFILHTKDFYPPGTFRVPSGTIQEGEDLLQAAYREVHEETGLDASVERFLAVLEFEFRWQGHSVHILSYLFLLHELQGQLQSQDPLERIASFGEASLADMKTIAKNLQHLPPDWNDWGWFRGIPHRIAAELLETGAK